jgi:hypothetical protein
LAALARKVVAGGLLAGVVIFLVMNLLVMPLSAAPVTFHQVIAHLRPQKAAENLVAMFMFGLIVASCARCLVAMPAAGSETRSTVEGGHGRPATEAR